MIKIWNRPKVEFGANVAYCMGFEIAFISETEHLRHADINAYGTYSYAKSGAKMQLHWDKNKTFEQAVNEWVENYVKQNFQPIVLPNDKRISMGSEYPEGWHDCREKFLKLNPDIIIEKVQ